MKNQYVECVDCQEYVELEHTVSCTDGSAVCDACGNSTCDKCELIVPAAVAHHYGFTYTKYFTTICGKCA